MGRPMASVLVQEPSRKAESRQSCGPRSGGVSETYLLRKIGYQGLSTTRQVFPGVKKEGKPLVLTFRGRVPLLSYLFFRGHYNRKNMPHFKLLVLRMHMKL